VIEKNLGLHIGSEDIYLNLAGGISIKETALDLGITTAVVSSFKNRPITPGTIVVGEVSLNGEVRRVKKLKNRLQESAKLGYKRAVVPMIDNGFRLDLPMEIVSVKSIKEAMEAMEL
jgi:DNA repair protein RadA/Sms